jgi:hypothetical protein
MIDPDSVRTIDNDPRNFFLKNIVLLGANKTGKTTLEVDIIFQLRKFIPNVYAFAGTPGAYEALKDIIPERLISKELTIPALEAIYKRQEEAAEVYKTANDINIMQSVFKRVAGKTQQHIEQSILELVNQSMQKITSSNMGLADKKTQEKAISDIAKSFRTTLYKGIIRKYSKILMKMKLTPAELLAVKFVDFNPNLLLIIDDCGDVLNRQMQNSKVFKALFYMYRHVYITPIFALQDDTSLEANLRKQVSLTFFTAQQCASAYFERSSNNFMKDMRMDAANLIRLIFDDKNPTFPKFTKLLYIRDDSIPLRKYLASEHVDFKFGSQALWKFCEKIDQQRKASSARCSTFGVY